MYPTITLFGSSFSTYNITLAISVFLPGVIYFLIAWKRGVPLLARSTISVCSILTVLIGAKVFAIVEARSFAIGFSLYGAIFLMPITILVLSKVFKLSFWTQFGTLSSLVVLFLGFAKIGCFLAGCCYGIPSDFGFVIDGVRRFPVQLFEAGTSMIVGMTLLVITLKRPNNLYIAPLAYIGYGFSRFIFEFYRASYLVSGGVSNAQVYSIVIMSLGLLALLYLSNHERTVGFIASYIKPRTISSLYDALTNHV